MYSLSQYIVLRHWQSDYVRLVKDNWMGYVQSEPVQNVAERNPVVLTDERVQSALMFKKKSSRTRRCTNVTAWTWRENV
jgi:hypothetical protein